jgi:glucosamine-6-phosphate deaminase
MRRGDLANSVSPWQNLDSFASGEVDQLMNVLVFDDYGSLSRAAADVVGEVLRARPEAALIFPTGNTPLGLFDELVARENVGCVDFSRARFYCLDEYLDVGPDDPVSLFGWLRRSFFARLEREPAVVHCFPSDSREPQLACASYEASLSQSGGIDLLVLGIGPNGHVGFNEPGTPENAPTRIVRLSPESIASNSGYWGSSTLVPRYGMTLGPPVILAARRIILLATGREKAAIVAAAATSPISSDVPASYLQRRPDVTFMLDREAGALI